jgi:inorganic pyrophosphatase
MRRSTAITLAVCILGFSAKAQPDEVRAMIEIPAGSDIKYEFDKASGRMEVDRFLSAPVAYPANYGVIPETLSEGGDELDVLVYTRAPIMPGALIRVRPIAILLMRDGGKADDKIIAVPMPKVDPTYGAVQELSDLPDMERQRLIAFFSTYKMLPSGAGEVQLMGFRNAENARQVVQAARKSWAGSRQ